jgi:hypothetical protein
MVLVVRLGSSLGVKRTSSSSATEREGEIVELQPA